MRDPAFGAAGAGAPGHPLGLPAQQALALALGALGYLFPLGLQLEKAGIVGFVDVQPAMVDFRDFPHHPVEKVPIVGDHQDGAFIFLQIVLEPDHHPPVQVVGRLVQNEQLAGGNEGGGHGHPLFLPAGQQGHGTVEVRQPQAGENGFGLEFFMGGAGGMQHLLQDCGAGEKIRILRQIADARAAGVRDGAAVGGFLPGQDFQQSGFAGAVDPDEAHLFPFGHG